MYLLIVTGLSGAGKTQALRRFEDAGYFCVDNLPCEMLQSFIQLCDKAQPPIERAAVVIDSRESVFCYDVERIFEQLGNMGVVYEVLFLDCKSEVLERRYSETRRRHPLGDDIRRSVEFERSILEPFHHRANYVIDTSNLKPPDFTRRLEALMKESLAGEFALIIESFGYKRGVPIEADVILDVRFSDNPFYEPELKKLSGRDAAVKEFIFKDKDFLMFIDNVEKMLVHFMPRYHEQGKRRLHVAFGCTGGRHRSVCAAEELYARMSKRCATSLIHRDMADEAGDIKRRTSGTDEK